MSIQSYGIGSPTRGFVFRVGEKRAIAHTVSADDPFAVDRVSVALFDSVGTAVVSGASGTITAVSATQYQLGYVWDTTGLAAGDYGYQLRYYVDAEELLIPGTVSLLPLTSKYDRWVTRVTAWIAENQVAEAQRQLTYTDLTQALQTALDRYELDQPRRILETVSLSAGVFEYSLPSGWAGSFSRVASFEYPVDDTDQCRQYLEVFEWETDEALGTWRFTVDVPSAGQVARIYYTARHTLSHTADTIPADHFEAVSMYAAGVALLTLANLAAQTTGPGIGADLVSYRTKQQEYQSQAKELMRRAESLWGCVNTLQPFVTWPYFPWHGR